MRLDYFVKLKYQESTIVLYFGVKYSLRDLLITMPDAQSSDMRHIGLQLMMSAVPVDISLL